MNISIVDTLVLSLKISLSATVIVMVLSCMVALWLVQYRSRLAKAIEIIIYVPMALPPVALGYGLLLLLGNKSVVGQFFQHYLGLDLSFSVLGAQIAGIAVSLGIGVRCMRLALVHIDPEQLNMAYLLGASKLQTLRSIVMPQCYRALLGGSVLVFLRIMSEFGATMVFAGTSLDGKKTLAIAIWTAMEIPGQEWICFVLVCVAVMISLGALCLVEIIMPQAQHRKWERV